MLLQDSTKITKLGIINYNIQHTYPHLKENFTTCWKKTKWLKRFREPEMQAKIIQHMVTIRYLKLLTLKNA